MKTCSACHRLYPEGGYCPVDGQALVDVAEVAPPVDPEDGRVGKPLCNGRYQIRRRVADGGMGRVYQALDTQKDRGVALKILHPEVAQDAVSVERFKREFSVSASLPHDYIVEVLDFERTEDQSYALVMEYLEGEELRMVLKREKVIPPERIIRMFAQAAIGLASAHDKKIVHRDLKPDNLFLCGTREGDLTKILDFGSVRDNSEGAKKLTVMGTTIGSPFYMSPEQAQALPSLDHRADVWSMAAIAYECLTGSIPFQGNTGPAILLSILSKDPEPASSAGAAHAVPETVDGVFEEALAKNVEIRTPTVGALVDKLGAAYGLTGDHKEWAVTSQAALASRITAGLPGALEKHRANKAAAPDTSAMDAAFRAGSEGGPSGISEDMVMGVPSGPPKWIFVAIGAGFIGLVLVVIVVIAIR